MTPEQRALRARIASHASWAQTPDDERTARTSPARRRSPVSRAYWDEKHPNDPKAAESAHREYMTRLALLSSQARARRRTGA